MSGNFDWQTEDERRNRQQEAWDEKPEPPPTSTNKRRRIPWKLLTVILVLLAGLGLTVWWRVQARIDATMQSLRNDVASTFNLVQLSAREQDEELFRSVLSGRDPAWTTTQLQLFGEGLFIDRAPIGLAVTNDHLPVNLSIPFDDAATDDAPATIEFSPDLNEAVVTTIQPFASNSTSTTTGTVLLEQTAVFRRGIQRWLLAPPEGEFWGKWQELETDRLLLRFPQRDEAIATKLSEDLTNSIDQLCATLDDIECADDYGLTVLLDTDLNSLATLFGRSGTLGAFRGIDRSDGLVLPTPTLIGRPLEDESLQAAGYQALLGVYLPPVLEAVVSDKTGYVCCEQGALFQVLFEHEMADLGYGQWPVDQADYDNILADGTRLSDLSYLWRRNQVNAESGPDLGRLYVVADFILTAFPDLSPAKLQSLLPVSPNIEEWLSRVLVDSTNKSGNSWILTSLDQAWWMFALQGSLDGGDPPAPLPDESLYLACSAEEASQRGGPAAVYRYNVGDESWEHMLSVEGFVWMSPLPTANTLLMQEFALADETWRTNVWRDQASHPLYKTDTGFSISFGETDPAGRYLVTYAWEPDQEQTNALLLDLDTCTDEGCDYSHLQGLPIWSPDGQLAIYGGDQSTLPNNTIITNERVIIFDPAKSFVDGPLTLADSPKLNSNVRGQSIGTGYAPFWLDDQTYGYIRVIRNGILGPTMGEEIVVGTTDNDFRQSVISSDELFQFLPADQDPRRVTLAYVAPHPIDRELIFIVAVDEVQKMAYVFSFDLGLRTTSLRLQVRYDLNHSFSFSPDGRYLIVTGRDQDIEGLGDDSGVLYLHNIAANTTVPFAIRLPFFLSSVTYDWTDDSQWLMLAMDDNLIALVSPDDRYIKPITHTFGTCTSVAWLDE